MFLLWQFNWVANHVTLQLRFLAFNCLKVFSTILPISICILEILLLGEITSPFPPMQYSGKYLIISTPLGMCNKLTHNYFLSMVCISNFANEMKKKIE